MEIIDQRLDETDFVPGPAPDEQFHFLHAQTVLLDTERTIERPEQLPETLPHLSTGSIFYHFIDARRRTLQRIDDLLPGCGPGVPSTSRWSEHSSRVDPYFTSLERTRETLADLAFDFFEPPR